MAQPGIAGVVGRWIATIGIVLGLLGGSFALGVRTATKDDEESAEATSVAPGEAKPQYACSMFCVPPLDDPGKCPTCGMEMVEVGEISNRLTLSDDARRLAAVRTVAVERRFVTKPIDLVGKLALDELQTRSVTAPADGTIRTLAFGFPGLHVRRGDKLVEFRSDALLAVQEEAIRIAARVKRAEGEDKAEALRAQQKIRAKLLAMGMVGQDVVAMENRGSADGATWIRSDYDGRVMGKHANAGAWVAAGTPIYTLGNLHALWLMLEAYESDLPWLRLGQEVEFEIEAMPGKKMGGKVAFMAPKIGATRTTMVRVAADARLGESFMLFMNPTTMMKPGMFVRARIKALVGEDGVAVHEQEIEDARPPMIIPVTAPLITGKRALVYVEVPGERGVFEGREVVLGPRTDSHYIVYAGLAEGDRVVVHGAFKIDSSVQIVGGPSMMNVAPDSDDDTARFRQTRCPVTGAIVNQAFHTDHDGKRIYFCCAACVKIYEATPRTYRERLDREGIELADAPQPQSICPIMEKPIVRTVFTDYNGERVYFCCPPCIPRFLDDPERWLSKMRANNVELEPTPADAR